jgi:hypothetical protein
VPKLTDARPQKTSVSVPFLAVTAPLLEFQPHLAAKYGVQVAGAVPFSRTFSPPTDRPGPPAGSGWQSCRVLCWWPPHRPNIPIQIFPLPVGCELRPNCSRARIANTTSCFGRQCPVCRGRLHRDRLKPRAESQVLSAVHMLQPWLTTKGPLFFFTHVAINAARPASPTCRFILLVGSFDQVRHGNPQVGHLPSPLTIKLRGWRCKQSRSPVGLRSCRADHPPPEGGQDLRPHTVRSPRKLEARTFGLPSRNG